MILRKRNSIWLLFFIAFHTPISCIQALAISSKKTAPISLQFEYALASLGYASYELIASAQESAFHIYKETKPAQQKVIDLVGDYLYQENNYQIIVAAFKKNLSLGIDTALEKITALCEILGIQPESHSHLLLNEQKLEWINNHIVLIKKSYHKLKPVLRISGTMDSLKRLLLLNPLVRNIGLDKLGSVLFAYTVLTIIPPQEIRDALYDKDPWAFALLAGVLGIEAAILFAGNSLSYFEKEKERLKEREKFVQEESDQVELRKNLPSLIDYKGSGSGFKKLHGTHNDTLINDLAFYIDWLKHPIKYFGKDNGRKALLLFGEPGNGKGIITKAISDESNTPIISINTQDVKNGKTAGLKLFAAEHIAKMRKSKSVIVLLDEFEMIVGEKESAKQYFLTLFDGVQKVNPHIRILFICNTNHPEKLENRLKRSGRISDTIYIGPPSFEQRKVIIERAMTECFGGAPSDIVEVLAQKSEHCSRAAVDELIHATYDKALYKEKLPVLEEFLHELEKIITRNDLTSGKHDSKQIA